jgi:hypothetical protein
MKYPASLDLPAKITTILVIVLFAIAGYEMVRNITAYHSTARLSFEAVTVLVLILAIVVSYIYAPRAYMLDSDFLTILRPGGNKSFKLADIVAVKSVPDGSIIWALRLFGVGGLFGYFGKYWTFALGSVTYYNTKKYNRIVITAAGDQKIMITPDDIGMLEELKNRLNNLNTGNK